MPYEFGYFFIKKPRVARVNSASTLPPTTLGTLTYSNGFSIQYLGIASTAYLTITGTRILTIINENTNHPDNLNWDITGKTIQEIADDIATPSSSFYNPNYAIIPYVGAENKKALLVTVVRQDILISKIIQFEEESAYMVDVHIPGDIPTSTLGPSISWSKNNFTFSNVASKWMVDTGSLYNIVDAKLDTLGEVSLEKGIKFKFFPTTDSVNNDISRYPVFTDAEVVASLQTPSSELSFPAAPILLPGTLQVKINNTPTTENINYFVNYGTPASLKSENSGPYLFTALNNVLKIRFGFDPDISAIQVFTLPLGVSTSEQLAAVINATATGFLAGTYTDPETFLEYLILQTERGTEYYQLRIENGSANNVLGYTDYQTARGSGNGKINFLSYKSETLDTSEKTSSFILSVVTQNTTNPFLGLYTNNFILLEDSILKTKDVDYLVTSNGSIELIHKQIDEKLTDAILKLDDQLFPSVFSISDDVSMLIKDVDYTVNTNAGWITLTTSAFPGRVVKASYINKKLGEITDEIILGGPPEIISNVQEPFAITSLTNQLEISLNSDSIQLFVLPVGISIGLTEIISTINATATGFVAYTNSDGFLALKGNQSGPKETLNIGTGSANNVFGFTNNLGIAGFGADGGEQALSVKYPPMYEGGFTAPSGGNTIIIKNNDVRARYPAGALLKVNSDFYQVRDSFLENRANIIGNITGPFGILQGSNDIFKFTINGTPITITIPSDSAVTLARIIDLCNAQLNGCAEIYELNGLEKIKLVASNEVVIGDGNANRTLGFEKGAKDTAIPDTLIITNTPFKITYINPKLYTSINPIALLEEMTLKDETPQNSSEFFFLGNVLESFSKGTVVKIESKYFYKIASVSYENNKTKITLSSRLDLPIYKDTTVEYTAIPVLEEGDTQLKTLYNPLLTQKFTLKKNSVDLVRDEDYDINASGEINLKIGVTNGDSLTIDYLGKRYIPLLTPLIANFYYFDFLREGSNVKVSFQIDNSDNFYFKVIHASTQVKEFLKDLEKRNATISNSSSAGFPSGEFPSPANDNSGSSSYYTDLGTIEDNLNICRIFYDFFDDRLYALSEERRLINGYIIGAENGYVTKAQVEASENIPPTRLFPSNDARPVEEKSEPYKIPALLDLNQNDAGSAALGFESVTIHTLLNDEETQINYEISKLTSLLAVNINADSIVAGNITGNIGGTIRIYWEYMANSPSPTLILNEADVVIADNFSTDITPADVAMAINSVVSAGGLGSYVTTSGPDSISISTFKAVGPYGSYGKLCFYVVSDTTPFGIGAGTYSAVRSRDILWTGGYAYPSRTVPGANSIHLDILNENTKRSDNSSKHISQQVHLEYQLEEWLAPYDTAFNLANIEKTNSQLFKASLDAFSISSTAFDDLKNLANLPVTALDLDADINSRIAILNSRKNDISIRRANLNNRVSEILNIISTEALLDYRYVWLLNLTHREKGYYPLRKLVIDNELKRQREAMNNNNTLGAVGSI